MTVADDCETVLRMLAEISPNWNTAEAIAYGCDLDFRVTKQILLRLMRAKKPQVEQTTKWVNGSKWVVYRLIPLH